MTSLHDAAKVADNNTLNVLLDVEKYNVDAQDAQGNTPLMLAAEASHAATVDLLLRKNADIHLKNKAGKTVLQMVFASIRIASARIADIFFVILKKECSGDKEKLAMELVSAECPLYYAIDLIDAEELRFMLENGNCDVDARDPETLTTALHHAINGKHYESAKLLIEHGADINALDSKLKIPVAYYHYSYVFDPDEELEVIKTFVERNARLTTCKENGEMQLQTLLESGTREIVQLLLKSNVDWSATNGQGDSLLTYLASNEILFKNQDILEDLQGKIKIDRALVTSYNRALLYASRNGIAKLVEVLLDSGVDPNVEVEGEMGLLFSIIDTSTFTTTEEEKPAKEIIQTLMLLLERGADPQAIGKYNRTVFHIMALQGCNMAESAIGQLVIDESVGKSIIDSVRNIINSNDSLKKKFDFCKMRLERLKKNKIFDTISLFDIITKDEKKLSVYWRNEEFCKSIEKYEKHYRHCSDSYYAYVMLKKLQRILGMVQIRRNIEIVCNAMNICYDSYYVIVDKITTYVISN